MYHNPEQEKVIVFNSLTKTLNIPGLIFSSIILPNPEMRRAMEETIDPVSYTHLYYGGSRGGRG